MRRRIVLQLWLVLWVVAQILASGTALGQQPHRPTAPSAAAPGSAAPMAALWADLLDLSGEKAYRAMLHLARTPPETIAFLREALPAARPVDGKRLAQLLQQLQSDNFGERDQARRELDGYDRLVVPGLKKALPTIGSLEARRRVEQMLARMDGPPSGEPLRWHRAVEVVEWLGSPQAKSLLSEWAKGARDARLTELAAKALRRWPAANGDMAPLNSDAPGKDVDGDPLPARAVLRLGSTRWRLDDFHNGVFQYAPDGKRLILVGSRGILSVDTKDGRVTRREDPQWWGVSGALITPDGPRVVASGTFYGQQDARTPALRSWNIHDLKELPPLLVEGEPRGFADGGKSIVLTTPQGVRRVSLDTGVETSFTPYPEDGMAGAIREFSSEGKTGVLYGKDRKHLLAFDLLAPRHVKKLEIPERMPHAVAISPDGKWLAAGGYSDFQVLLYDLTTGQPVRHLVAKDQPRSDVRAVAFSPDGKSLAFAAGYSDSLVVLWDLEKQQLRWKTPGLAAKLTFSPDSRYLAGTTSGRVHLWDAADGTELTGAKDLPAAHVQETTFTADGRGLLALGHGEVRLFDFPSGTLRQTFQEKQVRAAAISHDGQRLATSCFGKDVVRIWDVPTAKALVTLRGPGPYGIAHELTFSGDGSRLAGWGQDFTLRVWNAKNGRLVAEHRPRPEGFPKGVFDGDDDDDKEGRRRRIIDKETIAFSSHAACFSHDGSRFFWNFNKLRVYDVSSGKELQTVGGEIAAGYYGTVVSRDNEWLLTGSFGYRGRSLVNLVHGKRYGTLEFTDLADAGHGTLSPDGRMVAVSARAQTGPMVALYETTTLRRRLTIPLEHGYLYRLAFSPDSRYLAGTHIDGTVLVWDTRRLED